jgi:predicted dehydrogenase
MHATSQGWFFYYVTHLVDYLMFLNGPHRGEWVVGHAHGRSKLDDAHPSPDYVLGEIGFYNGVRAFVECGPRAPHLPGDNSFWLDAGVLIQGSEGWAQVIVGSGWRAMTRTSGGVIASDETSFHQTEDTFPYVQALADWLDDPAKVHPCNGEVSYHGFELAIGIVRSALDRQILEPPIEPGEPVVERMRRELPDSPPAKEQPK